MSKNYGDVDYERMFKRLMEQLALKDEEISELRKENESLKNKEKSIQEKIEYNKCGYIKELDKKIIELEKIINWGSSIIKTLEKKISKIERINNNIEKDIYHIKGCSDPQCSLYLLNRKIRTIEFEIGMRREWFDFGCKRDIKGLFQRDRKRRWNKDKSNKMWATQDKI